MLVVLFVDKEQAKLYYQIAEHVVYVEALVTDKRMECFSESDMWQTNYH